MLADYRMVATLKRYRKNLNAH
ncbi:hypothetical protein BLA29_011874 [Euroglyphus maynei]|uniref:Uncharacterized protein n=1 Tax=Euroglyphus maynei TaxID=6958 RepID=A0A1Y3B927_EURMA|nr:hypothetical protein BLA29_011874 [Euroglyphus maynei]